MANIAIKGAAFLFTDSGGLIRESSHLGKRCIVRRNSGAWPELIDVGFNIRTGINVDDMRSSLTKMGSLYAQNEPPPKLLLSQDGGSFALNVICSFFKKLSHNL